MFCRCTRAKSLTGLMARRMSLGPGEPPTTLHGHGFEQARLRTYTNTNTCATVLVMALVRDLQFAFRMLRRSPGYALTCVAVLALGIGANTAIFSVIHSVILKALPYLDAARLVFLWERLPHLSDPMSVRIQVARR